MKKKALVIVAHPDDETIWMGGTIMKNKNWDWTILSLCREHDKERAEKFKKVCLYYGARAIISDLEDEILNPLDIEDIIKKIEGVLPNNEYDYIFTHGKNGEYGHLRHKEINSAIKKMIKNGKLKCNEVYYFAYVAKSRHFNKELKIPQPVKHADLNIELDNETYENKIKLITEFYGFKENIFETLSCNKKETFVKN